jgi:hypothetical protein
MRRTTFLRLIEASDKSTELLALARQSGALRFRLTEDELRAIPLSPFAYWLSPAVRELFDAERTTEQHVSTRRGMASLDDFRFVRCGWEIPPEWNGWQRYAKGESSRPFVDTAKYVVNWAAEGREVKAYVEAKVGSASRTVQAESFYFRPGMTWVRRTSHLRVRCMPRGFIFSGGAQAAFLNSTDEDTDDGRMRVLGLLNSSVFDALIKVCVGRTGDAVQFEPGMIVRSPWPQPPNLPPELGQLAASAWRIYLNLDTQSEVSHVFVVPALLQVGGDALAARVDAWGERINTAESELARLQTEINELCFGLYGISEDDRRAITEGFGVLADVDAEAQSNNAVDGDNEASNDEVVGPEPAALAARLVSWAVGVAVGRFDVRLATGERALPPEPRPFDLLPDSPPALLTGDDGRPVVQAPAGYPITFAPVLVADPGHHYDITARVRAVFDLVFGSDGDRWWTDVGAALGAKDGEVGTWLAGKFFDQHLDQYTVPRSRKAPLLWPIGTRTGTYLVWLYAPRVSADTLFQVLNDVVAPKIALEEQELTRLRQDAGPDPTASQRKIVEKRESFVAELREMRQWIEEVAPLWAPNLNDGIVILLAPLWRLFAHHRAWSNELKKQWGKLTKGEYDWAQLAMHLWPERVIPKCADDRSIAIAHGLEEVFWVEDGNNADKWRPRVHPTTPIGELVAEHQNLGVAAALQRLAKT